MGTIKKILIVDLSARPSSQDVLNLVKHVREHTSSSKAEAFIPCGILSHRSEAQQFPSSANQLPTRPPPRPAPSFGQHAYDVPEIFGQNQQTPLRLDRPQSLLVFHLSAASMKIHIVIVTPGASVQYLE